MTYPNLVMEQLLFIARIVCTGQSIKIKNREHQQSCHDYSDKADNMYLISQYTCCLVWGYFPPF